MAPLTDPERLLAYKDALSNWAFAGYVEPELTEQAYLWIRRELGSFEIKELYRLMTEYVAAGGEIDEVRETRPEWSGVYEYHYDLRFSVHGQPIYVETRLNYRSPFIPDEPTILVVNVHAP
jgi:hypothetical protein